MTSCYLQILDWLLFRGAKEQVVAPELSSLLHLPAISWKTESVCGFNPTVSIILCFQSKHLDFILAGMMMVSDDCLVECKIDDSDEDESGEDQINVPPPPPEFASKASTPAPAPAPHKAPTPPAAPATPAPTPPVSRDPHGINQHLKVHFVSHINSDSMHLLVSEALWSSVTHDQKELSVEL